MLIPSVSRPAHGTGVRARPEYRCSRGYLREPGKGRVVYFPWDIDRTFGEVLATDHWKLLRNAVDSATNEPRPVTVSGPGMLEVTMWRQKEPLTVHLVDVTNPMAMKDPSASSFRLHHRTYAYGCRMGVKRSTSACWSAARRRASRHRVA